MRLAIAPGMTFCSCGHHELPSEHVRVRSAHRSTRRARTPQPRSRRFGQPFGCDLEVRGGGVARRDPRASISNVSQTGLLVRGSVLPSPGQVARLELICGGRRCVALGRVVSLRRGGFAVEVSAANEEYDLLFSALEAVREPVLRDLLDSISLARLSVA